MHAGAESVWDPVETLPVAQLRALQLERLRTTVDRVLEGQPAGAERLRAAGIASGADLQALEDLVDVPFATKADLREHYPFGLLTVPRERLLRVHASSGTHGKPTVVGYTAADLDTWTELMARCMTMAGVRPGMLVHNANGYGLFTGGLGFHQGAERIGATVVPVSGGFTARQALLLADLGAQVLVSTPSYALAIAQAVGDPNEISLERPYIQAHIEATRAAFGLTSRLREIEMHTNSAATIDIQKHKPLLDNVRLWDWRAFHDTISQIQPLRPYVYMDTDVDRYTIGGQLRQVLIAPRELDTRQLGPAGGRWINTHLM